jgi:hypothetical protein
MYEMDLSSGAREFGDIEMDEEDDRYKGLTWKEKVVWQFKNW